MIKYCPFKNTEHYPHIECNDRCVLFNGECMAKKALEIYIKNHTPFTLKQPTEEELNRLTEMLAKQPAEPMLFRHPDLNVEHDYDEHGVDWYPHGYDDIAP